MLELRDIKKDYPMGAGTVHALKGVSIQFRRSEFVSILGPSGCGKTTLLNIIGGAGPVYRRRSDHQRALHQILSGPGLGFLPQPLGRICVPELQPDPPPDGAAQRRAGPDPVGGQPGRAAGPGGGGPGKRWGLGNQLYKRPKRDVGRPDAAGGHCPGHRPTTPNIILADEPTGALDTETSIQVMELLKEISKDRLNRHGDP